MLALGPQRLTSGAGGGSGPDPLRNLILDYEWVKNGTGTLTDNGPDAMHFLSDGSSSTSGSKMLDVIPGATYRVIRKNFRVGTSLTPIVRFGYARTSSNLINDTITVTSQQTVTTDVVPAQTPSYFSAGYGASGAEIDVAGISVKQTVPSVAIPAFGDSLTQGTGATNTTTDPYPAVASGKFTPARIIMNLGLGGQNSLQIAARQGGLPITVTLSGNQIPASGGVAVTAKNINILTNAAAFSGTSTGFLAGVHGTMSTDASGNWTFTRDNAGSVVAVSAGSVFTPDIARNTKTLTQWWLTGRNDIGNSVDTASNIVSMVSYLGHSRFLAGSILPSRADGDLTNALSIERVAKNAATQATYGSKYLDVLTPLQAAGDGSANDNSDIANGWTPRSLRWDTGGGVIDPVHLNSAGYAIVAQTFYNAHIANGYA